jgi:hypothetical protein
MPKINQYKNELITFQHSEKKDEQKKQKTKGQQIMERK